MKLGFSVLIVLVASSLICKNEIETLWTVLWNYLFKMDLHPDSRLNISQFLAKYGYPLEYHNVTTEDGYILTNHRIPHGVGGVFAKQTRPVAVFSHCLACSSMDWVWQGPNASLPLILADQGYDIWLVNHRGTVHSRHETLNPQDSAYWDFSFHEKGFYDLAAILDYILDLTEVHNVTYVGHSQGTSAGLVLTSSKPRYNDKINLMVLLSPIVYWDHANSPVIKLLVDYNGVLKPFLELFGIYGMEWNYQISFLSNLICNEASSLQGLCIFLIDLFVGFDNEQVDRSKLTVYLSNTPNGVSVKEVQHFIQELQSGAFRQYDYGNLTNLLHYGSTTPPSYDLHNITAPLAVYYAKNDFLASIIDVERFLSEIHPNTPIIEKYLIDYDYFNHLDFITAKDVKTLLYDRVIDVIRRKNPV